MMMKLEISRGGQAGTFSSSTSMMKLRSDSAAYKNYVVPIIITQQIGGMRTPVNK